MYDIVACYMNIKIKHGKKQGTKSCKAFPHLIDKRFRYYFIGFHGGVSEVIEYVLIRVSAWYYRCHHTTTRSFRFCKPCKHVYTHT